MASSNAGENLQIAATATEILRVNAVNENTLAFWIKNAGSNALTSFEIQCRAYDWSDGEKGWETVVNTPGDYTDPPTRSPLSANHAANNDPTTLVAGASIFFAINLENYPYLRILATSANGTQLSYGYTLMGGD